MHLCTSVISLLGSIDNPDRFPPQILSSKTIPDVNTAIWTKGGGRGLCRSWVSTTWLHDRAAFVHMAKDGKDNGDGLEGDGMKGR